MTMLDHVGLDVASYAVSKAFYTEALAPLGYAVVEEIQGNCGFRPAGKPQFWIHEAGGAGQQRTGPVHIAFGANDRSAVDKFYGAAIAAGGRCNGKPGLREIYHPNYYGAFVFDPDGNNVEAVSHFPE